MEQGPVLLIQFHAHQIECWRDFKQEVVVGNPVSVCIYSVLALMQNIGINQSKFNTYLNRRTGMT